MGDLFHQTNANQSATNQQIGISTRDVGGSVTTGAAGSVTSGSGISVGSGATVNVQSLDAAALQAGAQAVHDSVESNTAISQNALQAYQNALSVVAENQQATQAIATGQTAQGTSLIGQIGINPSNIIWGTIAVVAVVLIMGFVNKRKH